MFIVKKLSVPFVVKALHFTERNFSNYILIKPQLLPCAPACGCEFHTLAVHPQPTLTAPSIGGTFGVRSNINAGAFLRK